MTDCARFEEEISAMLAGESAGQSTELDTHLKECRHCATMVDMHRDLELFDVDSRPVADEELAGVRAAVLGQIRTRQGQAGGEVVPFYARRWFGPVLMAAGMMMGMLIGLDWRGGAQESDPKDFILNKIRNVSMSGKDAPFDYSNVSFQEMPDGSVALGFDVTTYVETVGNPEDPMVKELMVQSLTAPSTIGARLSALETVEKVVEKRTMDDRVKDALLVSLARDEALVVRMKAMTLLAEAGDDEDVRTAFIHVLESEENVQLRLMAMEYLAGHRKNGELDEVIDLLEEKRDIPTLMNAPYLRLQ